MGEIAPEQASVLRDQAGSRAVREVAREPGAELGTCSSELGTAARNREQPASTGRARGKPLQIRGGCAEFAMVRKPQN